MILTLRDRLAHIVGEAYQILCQQIAQEKFHVYNEASLQMQLSVILKTLGQLYEFSRNDHFDIELEEWINLKEATEKSLNKRARCDIWLRLSNDNGDYEECAIELKCFKKSQGETTTDNRFSVLSDIENLEQYKNANEHLICYEIVYTDNINYTKKDSRSYLPIGDDCTCSGDITSNNRTIHLQGQYTFLWDKYQTESNDCYFIKIRV